MTLSRIFQWYGGDFGRSREEMLRFIAPYLHDRDDRRFLEKKAGSLEVTCQDYDWRLNRT